jgi:hypothetical protein
MVGGFISYYRLDVERLGDTMMVLCNGLGLWIYMHQTSSDGYGAVFFRSSQTNRNTSMRRRTSTGGFPCYRGGASSDSQKDEVLNSLCLS